MFLEIYTPTNGTYIYKPEDGYNISLSSTWHSFKYINNWGIKFNQTNIQGPGPRRCQIVLLTRILTMTAFINKLRNQALLRILKKNTKLLQNKNFR